MRDATTRDRYLDEVAARLRLPDDLRNEVIEELATHLADATDDAVARGVSYQDAEREAVSRLGPPEALADRLRRTHQTTRRLFAAVGGGLWAAGKDAVRGYLVGIILAWFGLAFVGAAHDAGAAAIQLEIPTSLSQAFPTTVTAVAVWPAAWWAAGSLITVTATRSRRRTQDVGRIVALLGTTVVGFAALTWRTPHSTWSVAAVLVIPVIFAASAVATARGRPSMLELLFDRVRLIRLAFWTLVAVLVLAIGSVGIAVLRPGGSTSDDPEVVEPGVDARYPSAQERWVAAGYQRVAPTVAYGDDWLLRADSSSYASSSGRPVEVQLANDTVDWDDLSGLTLEAWPAVDDPSSSGWMKLDPAAARPFMTAPVIDPWTGTTELPLFHDRDAVGYLLFLVAIDPQTGERIAVGQPEAGHAGFFGSVVEWFAADGDRARIVRIMDRWTGIVVTTRRVEPGQAHLVLDGRHADPFRIEGENTLQRTHGFWMEVLAEDGCRLVDGASLGTGDGSWTTVQVDRAGGISHLGQEPDGGIQPTAAPVAPEVTDPCSGAEAPAIGMVANRTEVPVEVYEGVVVAPCAEATYMPGGLVAGRPADVPPEAVRVPIRELEAQDERWPIEPSSVLISAEASGTYRGPIIPDDSGPCTGTPAQETE